MTDPAAAAQGLMLLFLATEHIVSAALAPIFAAQGAVVLIFPGPIDCRMHRIIRSFMGLSMSILNCLSRRFMPFGEFVDRGKLRAARIVSLPGAIQRHRSSR